MSAGSVAARSRIVRGTLVTGIPSSTVRSSRGTWEMCLLSWAEERLRCGTVTSILVREVGLIIQR